MYMNLNKNLKDYQFKTSKYNLGSTCMNPMTTLIKKIMKMI